MCDVKILKKEVVLDLIKKFSLLINDDIRLGEELFVLIMIEFWNLWNFDFLKN